MKVRTAVFFSLCCLGGINSSQAQEVAALEMSSQMVGASVQAQSEPKVIPFQGVTTPVGNISGAHPSEKRNFDLNFTYSGGCKKLSVEYFWSAYHPGEKNRQKVYRGSLNEYTPGVGINCYVTNSWYFHTADLVNSQRGKSRLLAFGGTLESPPLHNFTVLAHTEVGHLEYEVPRYQTVVSGYIPLVSLEVKYKLPRRWGSLGAREYRLPVGGIKLYSFTWSIPLGKTSEF